MSYFLLSCTEDGGYVETLTKAQVMDLLTGAEEDRPQCVAKVPDKEISYWGEKNVLIKGEIIVPQPVQIVTEWTID